MSCNWPLQKTPRAFDPNRGEEVAEKVGVGAAHALLAGAAGSSPYLASVIEKEADWVADALAHPPEAALDGILRETSQIDLRDLKPRLRRGKRRLAALTALADLGGVWTLEEVTGALTRYADHAVQMALDLLTEEALRRQKLPDTDAVNGGLVALAMGKMGAGELNYSSDIDLVMVFDEGAYDDRDFLEARTALVRITRNLGAALSDVTGDGYVFRTDFRLRPDPAVTPVALSMEAAERYYESLGRTWERAAYIKARAAAGDIAAGERFLGNLTPFVWRRHLDYAAIQDAYDMRSKIRAHKGLYDRKDLEGYDLKLARGGIREIEFFTQTRQLIAGGRDPELRCRGTVEALGLLAKKEWIPQDVCQTLQQDYRDLRTLEHRVQMVNDQQTHALPRDADGFGRVAAMMDREPDELRAEIIARRDRVGGIADAFFNPPMAHEAEDDVPPDMDEIVQRWPSYPALRSPRAIDKFRRVRPALLQRVGELENANEALRHIDGFLAGLPAGVQLFSLFEANPQLIDLVVDIAGVSPSLAAYLGRNSQVFDAVIGGGFFEDWEGADARAADLTALLSEEDDYERKLDLARRWAKEWRFRVGVHHLRGLIDANQAGEQYADLAEAVLRGLSGPVSSEFARKHGEEPGRGAMLLGMGSLGARQLNAGSDLDLIVIYDAHGIEASDGSRPLATRQYFARLTQAYVTALSAPMSQGRLYEVDMRLRPSGRQGPVATALSAFRDYQLNEAWTWEHLALTRARPISGDAELCAAVEAVRSEILGLSRDPNKIRDDVSAMRKRLAEARPSNGPLDAKNSRGRLQDIALLAQTGALLAGSHSRTVVEQITSGAAALEIGDAARQQLIDTHDLLWTVYAALRLTNGSEGLDQGVGTARFLCRATGTASIEVLDERISSATKIAAETIDRALNKE